MQERSIVGLRVIRRLGDEDDGVDGRGIQPHLDQQSLRGIGAQIQRCHARSGDTALAEADRLGGALQGHAIEARGESVRDEITHDRTRGHGDPGESDVGKGGVPFGLGDKLASGHVDKGRHESIEYGELSIA